MTDSADSFSSRQVVTRALWGALTAHFALFVVIWFFSIGSTLMQFLGFALIRIAGPLVLGGVVGLLWNWYRPRRSRVGPFAMGALITVIANLASVSINVRLGLPTYPNLLIRYMIASGMIIAVGLLIALLIFGFLALMRWFGRKLGGE